MEYFRLRDDMLVPRRWHLGDVTRSGEDLKVFLDAGAPIGEAPVSIDVTQSGTPLDFTLTAFAVPVVTSRLASLIATFTTQADIEIVPALVPKHGDFRVANVLRTLACVDEARSEFLKWTSSDHRADLAGQYRSFGRLVLDAHSIPEDAHLFRLWGWVALIVSGALKDAIISTGCSGAAFDKV